MIVSHNYEIVKQKKLMFMRFRGMHNYCVRSLANLHKKARSNMTIFFERFSELCSQIGSTPNAEAKKIGIPSGSITAWKNGSIPRPATVQKIADHFQVPAAFLMGWAREPSDLDKSVLLMYPDYRIGSETIPEYLARTGKNPRPASESGFEIDDPELVEILEQMKNRSEMRMLFKLATNASAEDVRRAINIIEALRKEE